MTNGIPGEGFPCRAPPMMAAFFISGRDATYASPQAINQQQNQMEVKHYGLSLFGVGNTMTSDCAA